VITRATDPAKRLAQQLKVRGSYVTLRHYDLTSGPYPTPNPPQAVGLTLNGSHASGTTSLSVRGAPLVGRFIAGDQLTIAGTTYTVNTAGAAVDNISAVILTTGLVALAADATVVTATYLNDHRIPAEVRGFGKNLIDGNLIQQSDFAVTISSASISFTPSLTDILLLKSGESRRIVSIQPMLVQQDLAGYTLQAR
jgi:hypothetical protein